MEKLDDLVKALLHDADEQVVRTLLVGDRQDLQRLEDEVTNIVAGRLREAS